VKTPQPLEDAGAPLPNGWKGSCGARTRDGTPCRRPPLAGRTRCRLHGGNSPGGIAAPHFKHGRRSKYFPKDLRAKFNAAYEDGEYTSLRNDLALQESRVIQLLGRLGKDPPVPWSRLKEAVGALREAETDDEMEEAVGRLEELTDKGRAASLSQDKTWTQLRELVQERTRTAIAENRMLHDRSMYVAVEHVALLVRAMLAAQKELIHDKDLLRRINLRTVALIPPDLRGGVGQGDSVG
jgi:hypothetical protein